MSIDRRFGRSCMIGRKQEVKELNRLYNRNKAELVAIYGRRRVGKTYLIKEFLKRKNGSKIRFVLDCDFYGY